MRTLSTDIEIRFQQEMRLRRYSPVSIRVYTFALRAWLAWLGELDPRAATSETMRAYLLTLADTGSSEAWLGQTVSALKVLYVYVFGRPAQRFRVPRPRRAVRLPRVPTRDQILRMAGQTPIRTHRLAILVTYASGVRVSELCRLRIRDADLHRNLLFVDLGKGAKDRITLLSPRIENDLRREIAGRPRDAPLIRSRRGGALTTRTVQRVVREAGERADVGRVTPHLLRHAFATHLFENGTDLHMIKRLMGHASIKTTWRYTRMADPRRFDVESPL